jgi:hypothetical protein
MMPAKSFGILIEGTGGGVGDRSRYPDRDVKIEITSGTACVSALES